MKVDKNILNRRSTVAYSDKMIEPKILESLFEAARWAPSSYNEQPWRFIYALKVLKHMAEYSNVSHH